MIAAANPLHIERETAILFELVGLRPTATFNFTVFGRVM